MNDSYAIEVWIKNNPMNAENQEDLWNWACEEFNVSETDENEVWAMVRKLQGRLPK